MSGFPGFISQLTDEEAFAVVTGGRKCSECGMYRVIWHPAASMCDDCRHEYQQRMKLWKTLTDAKYEA